MTSHPFERAQIEALLRPDPRPILPASATYICPLAPEFDYIFQTAIAPALSRNAIHAHRPNHLFDSDAPLATLYTRLQTSQILLFDLTHAVPDVLYALGLAHASGRSPILLFQHNSPPPPFDLAALRHFPYHPDQEGLLTLREDLTRTIRIHLTSTRTDPQDDIT